MNDLKSPMGQTQVEVELSSASGGVWQNAGAVHGAAAPPSPDDAEGGGGSSAGGVRVLGTALAVQGRHSFWAACFNFINSIVGAGIIGLAFSLKQAGLFLGLAMLVGIAALTGYSVKLLVRTGAEQGVHSYEELCERAFGRAGFYVASAMMFAFAFGAMLAYLIIIGDTVPVVLGNYAYASGGGGGGLLADRSFMIVLCAGLVCLPLSSLRDIGKLGATSGLSMVAVLTIVLLVVARAPTAASDQGLALGRADQGGALAFARPDVSQAFGGMAFAFVCQHSSFLVRNTMREPHRWAAVTHVSVATATALSLALAVSGYASFLLCTRPDVLNNFYGHDDAINGARLLLALTMFFTYPMEFFVARQSLHALLARSGNLGGGGIGGGGGGGGAGADGADGAAGHAGHADIDVQNVSAVRHWAYTLGLFSASLLLGLVLEQDHLHLVLDISGGVAASFLGFILPGGISMALAHAADPRHGVADGVTGAVRWARFFRRFPKQVTLVLVGSLAFTTSLYFALSAIGKPKHASSADTCPVTGAEN